MVRITGRMKETTDYPQGEYFAIDELGNLQILKGNDEDLVAAHANGYWMTAEVV